MHWLLWCCGVFFVLSTISVKALSRNDIYNELIQKYSESKQFLTVDQFQLLLNSINNPSNKTASEIQELEKCDGTLTECSILPQDCLTAKELFENIHVTDGKLDADSFDSACPLILGQVESNVCGIHKTRKQRLEKEKPSAMEVWGLGLLFVTVISLCSLIGVSVLPFMAKAFYKQMLTVLIGLAVGSLSGSSVFHLIPQAFGLMQGDNHHGYLNISLMMWGGIWVFFMTERIMKLISDAKQNGKPRGTISKDVTGELSAVTDLSPHANHEVQPLQNQLEDSRSCLHANPVVIYDYQEQAIKASFGHQEKARVSHNDIVHFEQGKDSAIATVAWMVIFGDGLHNFIDGLSIGAAFSESILTGVSISLAVLCEEFPHELGDFAVLLNAGMTMKQALLYNFLSACTCYLGLILGIILGEIEANTYIFGFAGGMFLYISLVDMIPEMNEVAEEASKLGVKNACKTLLLQNLGMGVGMLALYTLARYQDSFAFS